MISKRKIILSFFVEYIVTLFLTWGLVALVLGNLTMANIICATFIITVMEGVGMVLNLIQWQQLWGAVFPIYEKEGFSPYFFEAAEQHGTTLEKEHLRTRYYLVLSSFYQVMGQYDNAVVAFSR